MTKIKQVPFSEEAECAVLGSIFINPELANYVFARISTDSHFYLNKYRTVFQSIHRLSQQSKSIDYVTIIHDLEVHQKNKEISKSDLISIADYVPTSANINYYIDILVEKFKLRQIINLANYVNQMSFEESNTKDILEFADKSLFDLSKGEVNLNFSNLNESYQDYLTELEGRIKNSGLQGISSGYESIDQLTNGFKNQNLIVMAGRPGSGKSAFLVNLAHNASKHFNEEAKKNQLRSKSVGIFSLEMGVSEITERFAALINKVDGQNLARGTLSDDDWNSFAGTMNAFCTIGENIFINDSGELSIAQFRTAARRLVREKNCGIIFIDYLQLM